MGTIAVITSALWEYNSSPMGKDYTKTEVLLNIYCNMLTSACFYYSMMTSTYYYVVIVTS